ncbi:multicopper oxidase domain-containing protein [Tepidibacillus marianensis]|uniref:multicopper oxidase family protein n=1 Tax=Tepidibacillus marianensis TaxID=3131995 RepID=UPI0030D05AF0
MRKRNGWVIVFLLSLVGLIFYIFYMFSNTGNGLATPGVTDSNQAGGSLPIPQILKDTNPDPKVAEFNLNTQKGTMEFFSGTKTNTYGYNGNFLGPIIRVRTGEQVKINVKNGLDEPTTVHWHGLEIPGKMDGGPHQEIYPGQVWSPNFTINQPAATLWYHPHLLHKTGEQVFKGLAGLIYIDDDISDRLTIPKDYGKNDIPLVIQDRRFTSSKQFDYNIGMRDMMMGILGDTVLVNGAINPYFDVTEGKIRMRLLNGSNARIYNFHLSDNQPFWQIASDGGFLEKPVELTEVKLAPGERAEIIVDFSKYKIGDQIELQSDDFSIMNFRVKATGKDLSLPNQLVTIDKIPESEATVKRAFEFQGMGPTVNINGKQFNMERIDENLKLNAMEVWEISNTTMGMSMGRNGEIAHPFHAHGVQFQILDRDGKTPPLNETGWKDTILVHSGETVRAIARFKYEGMFMYHCHILEHEDAGMMGQFQVGQGK